MSRWPKWIRITFIISGCLFVLAGLATCFILGLGLLIPPGGVAPGQTPVSKPESPTVVLTVTAITGLVTAVSGLYGQILAGRKQKLDYELAKQQLQMQAEAKPKKPRRPKKK